MLHRNNFTILGESYIIHPFLYIHMLGKTLAGSSLMLLGSSFVIGSANWNAIDAFQLMF